MQERESHTELYERMALLEANFHNEMEKNVHVQTEVDELKAKLPNIEIKNESFIKMKNDFNNLELRMKKVVESYEEKLSAMALEIIRLKTVNNGKNQGNGLSRTDSSFTRLKERPPIKSEGNL